MNRIMSSLIITIILTSCAHAGGHHEKWYQDRWCAGHGGRAEVSMPDGTRCDCVTDSHAIEFDFGRKWSEAIGQSLNYAMQTSKRAGIVMIVENDRDRRYWIRLNSIIAHYNLPISTWMVTP